MYSQSSVVKEESIGSILDWKMDFGDAASRATARPDPLLRFVGETDSLEALLVFLRGRPSFGFSMRGKGSACYESVLHSELLFIAQSLFPASPD